MIVRNSWIAEIGSLLALAISVVALGVSAYQTRLMQQQARASVWPLLKIGYRITDHGDGAGVALEIDNNGVGPAKIETVKVSLDGKPIRRWEELFPQLQIDPKVDVRSQSMIGGQVQPPSLNRDTMIEPLLINPGDAATRFAALMPRLGIEICYCSVYEDCWVSEFHRREVKKAARCEVGEQDEFLE